jgi:hypothetical protein
MRAPHGSSGLAETNQILLLNDLRSRVVVETDGQLKTGRDVAIAALLGAEEYGFATAPLVTMGCLMMRVCQKNTCPVGVATQDPRLRKNFTGKPEHVVNFMKFIAMEMRESWRRTRLPHGQRDGGARRGLETAEAINHWKAKGVDLTSPSSTSPMSGPRSAPTARKSRITGWSRSGQHAPAQALQAGHRTRRKGRSRVAHRQREPRCRHDHGKRNHRRHGGGKGLPDDTIHLKFIGSAGQSFAAFHAAGMTFELEGDANDYVGKGLSGSKVIVYPPKGSGSSRMSRHHHRECCVLRCHRRNAFINGIAGERFCVRNSGVRRRCRRRWRPRL